jgi:hypothetical protein
VKTTVPKRTKVIDVGPIRTGAPEGTRFLVLRVRPLRHHAVGSLLLWDARWEGVILFGGAAEFCRREKNQSGGVRAESGVRSPVCSRFQTAGLFVGFVWSGGWNPISDLTHRVFFLGVREACLWVSLQQQPSDRSQAGHLGSNVAHHHQS